MDMKKFDEEKLREACSYGDLEIINSLLNKGVNINSQNSMNGWTSLHWACKRGHLEVVKYLLSEGADPNLKNVKNEMPAQLTTKEEILNLLTTPSRCRISSDSCKLRSNLEEKDPNHVPLPLYYPENQNEQSPFTLLDEELVTNGTFPHNVETPPEKCCFVEHRSSQTSPPAPKRSIQTNTVNQEPKKMIILKIRVADTNDPDFIEVDVPSAELSYSQVLLICSRELAINPQHVERMRKLPNTRLRNDRDVQRLQNLQELELVVKGLSSKGSSSMKVSSLHSNPQNNFKSITNFKNQTILY